MAICMRNIQKMSIAPKIRYLKCEWQISNLRKAVDWLFVRCRVDSPRFNNLLF